MRVSVRGPERSDNINSREQRNWKREGKRENRREHFKSDSFASEWPTQMPLVYPYRIDVEGESEHGRSSVSELCFSPLPLHH